MRMLLAALLLTLPIAAPALQVTDDRGVTVTLPATPQRIVSLLPSLTETVCELGRCDRLVGVDRYSNFPAPVRKLPQVGGGIDPNIEAVVALKPDVVLMATSSRGAQRLEALGLKVIALEPRSSADVQRVMGLLGKIVDAPDAPRIWRNIDAGVAAVAQSLPPAARNLRVYYEVSTGGYAAGNKSFIGEMMLRLGLKNIVADHLGPFPRVNPEYVVRADPHIIMIGARNAMGLEQRPGWAGMRALREQRVCVFTAEESDILVRPGPRMADAARLVARCVTEKGLTPSTAGSKRE
ncbi:ABC transporter substrate-binding protein [Caenimonas sedimenti]|uniref:ABC transporter substrate-binding protein n=1 Tax=Caenimonas sedimenti TaxID=2596921 RepID=A0A562ZT87_9BURK|nr:ABC transporter substrate-binding protein [Caenimonas sedimenti]TWO71576.1 ABC transporter substrate-binding protein [Caenimonas sedimenti]